MRRALGAGLIFVLFGTLAACGGGGAGSSSNTLPPAVPVDLRGQKQVEVSAVDNRFEPASIIIDAGTKVVWKNSGATAHNVHKSADAVDFGGTFGVDTADFGPGQSYAFTFDTLGTYTYTCTIHSLMDGQVRVEAK